VEKNSGPGKKEQEFSLHFTSTLQQPAGLFQCGASVVQLTVQFYFSNSTKHELLQTFPQYGEQ
jgi:hypothetical protein